jgi:hypothetical protein
MSIATCEVFRFVHASTNGSIIAREVLGVSSALSPQKRFSLFSVVRA